MFFERSLMLENQLLPFSSLCFPLASLVSRPDISSCCSSWSWWWRQEKCPRDRKTLQARLNQGQVLHPFNSHRNEHLTFQGKFWVWSFVLKSLLTKKRINWLSLFPGTLLWVTSVTLIHLIQAWLWQVSPAIIIALKGKHLTVIVLNYTIGRGLYTT